MDGDAPRLPRRARKDDPKMIGLWKLGRILGQGSSGRVRIARHSKTGIYAAVKIIPRSLAESRFSFNLNFVEEEAEKALRAAEREIVIMKLIEHPNILRLYDVWTTSSNLYLILEYAEGGELFDYLCKKGRLSNTEALGYFQQVIGAVDYCHRFNICHRDLKPENILLDKNHNIKVADFGMAVWQANDGSDSLLNTSCGSPHYAAPEVVRGIAYEGAKADIWSCGVILYALLVNKLPFDHEDFATLLGMIRVGKFSMPSHLDPLAKDLISRMIEVDVNKRIQMPGIIAHPFFTSQPIKAAPFSLPSFEQVNRPLSGPNEINQHIFSNLRTLWSDATDEALIQGLLTSDPTWEKGVYHLLVRYRERHIENYDPKEEERARRRLLRHSKKRVSRQSKSSQEQQAISISPSPEVNGPVIIASPPSDDFVHVPALPEERPSNIPGFASPHAPANTPIVPYVDPLSSSHTTSSPMSPKSLLWGAGFGVPPLNAHDDLEGHDFFQQVLDHLEAMEARSADAAPVPDGGAEETFGIRRVAYENLALASPPLPLSTAELPRCVGMWIADDDHGAEGPQSLTSAIDRALFSPVMSPRAEMDVEVGEIAGPPVERRFPRRPVPLKLASSAGDKENQPISQWESKKENVRTSAFSSPSNRSRPVLGSRQIQFTQLALPPRKRPVDLELALPSPALTDGSSAPTTPTPITPLETSFSPEQRPSWFANPFKLKTATYELLSVREAAETRDACRRLLEQMGVRVSALGTGGVGALGLKCELPETRDPAGVMGVVRSVRFRIELRAPGAAQGAVGFLSLARLVQEKGALASFKMVFNRLRRQWELDAPGQSWEVISDPAPRRKSVGGLRPDAAALATRNG